jgi:prophage tail gpP-like protein
VSLAPSAVVTLGNRRYDSHAREVRVELRALPGVNAFSVAVPAGVDVDATPGDAASLELDGGEGAETVLTGKVRALRRGLRTTRAIAADGGADLGALRPAATYERQDARAVIRALASDAGADVGRVDIDIQLAAYVAHQGRTAAEHVAELAELAGAVAGFDAEGALGVAAPASSASLALRYGRDLIVCETDGWPEPGPPVVPVGYGPAGSVNTPGAMRHTLEAIPAGATEAGPDALRRPVAILHTPSTASAAGTAASERHSAGGTRVRARGFLLPALRPGDVVDIQDLPDGLEGGPWLLTAVTHRLGHGEGGTTQFEGRAASGGAGLLGGALGAVGGLL